MCPSHSGYRRFWPHVANLNARRASRNELPIGNFRGGSLPGASGIWTLAGGRMWRRSVGSGIKIEVACLAMLPQGNVLSHFEETGEATSRPHEPALRGPVRRPLVGVSHSLSAPLTPWGSAFSSAESYRFAARGRASGQPWGLAGFSALSVILPSGRASKSGEPGI